LTGPAKSSDAAHACLALLKAGETATFAAATSGIFGAPLSIGRLCQQGRHHYERCDYNFGSKAHREHPDLDWKT
jgi:hypothetical protein